MRCNNDEQIREATGASARDDEDGEDVVAGVFGIDDSLRVGLAESRSTRRREPSGTGIGGEG